LWNIEVRSGEAVDGRRIPTVRNVTKSDVFVTPTARKKAIDERPKRMASIRGAEKPRCREQKSVMGVRRRPEVPAAAMTDLSNGVPLNCRTKIIRIKTP
jgi:hypothetical protein